MSSGTLTIAISTTTSSALAVTEGATGVLLTMPAALTGTAPVDPATHYISAGFVRPAIRAALVGHCDITDGYQDPRAIIADAGLAVIATGYQP